MAIVVEGTYTSTSVKTTTSSIGVIDVTQSLTNAAFYVFLSHHQKSSGGGKYATKVMFQSGDLGDQQSLINVGREEYVEEIVEIWRLLAPRGDVLPSSCQITWVDNNANWDGSCHAAVVLSGIDQDTPDDGWNANSGTGTSSPLDVPTTIGDLCYAINSVDSYVSVEAGDGTQQWTLIADQNYSKGVSHIADDTTTNFLFTIAESHDWAIAGISINPFVEPPPSIVQVPNESLINRKINNKVNGLIS